MKITTQLNPSLPVLSKNPTASNFLPKGLPTDIQGADLEALTRFNQSLPKVVPKVLKKPGEEEALDELSEVVSDSPEWQMAQAEAVGAGAGAEAAAAAAAEAAGAGAAGSGAAGAAGAGAAGAAGAGAAGAVGVLSPLAFTPSLLLVNGGSNSAPIATFTTAQNADEDGSVISGQLTSTDPDGIDLGTTYSLVGDPIPGLTINENGAWSFDATGNAYQSLAQGETREITVTYVVTDTPGATDTASFVITVTGTNDVPVVQVTDVVGGVTELVTPAGNLSDSGTISFTDVDLIDLHTVSEVTPSEDALGTLTATVSTGTDDSTGLGGVITWNYSVAASAVEYLAEGETKVETFTFSLLDGNGGSVERTVSITITGTNDVPVLEIKDPVYRLPLNADVGEIESCAEFSIDDKDDNDTHTYLFWNDGTPAAISTDGYFIIETSSGKISLTKTGEEAIGAGKPALPCAPSISLAVVAYDGINYSEPQTLTIDRVLPDFVPALDSNPEGVDALYSVNLITDPNGESYANAGVSEHHGVPHITIQDNDGGMDLIDFDAPAFSGLVLDELEMFRKNKDGNDALYIEIEGAEGAELHLSVDNHFATAEDGAPVEFVHFQKGTEFARYDLGGSNEADVTWSCDGEVFQDHGVYLISTNKATAHGDTVSGTVCNDVVVGSSDFKEVLSGGEGNDLLFSRGQGDTVVGGAGDDLIVLDEDHDHDHHHKNHDHPTVIAFETADTNGFDTIVGFDEDHTRIQLQAGDTGFALQGEDVDVLTKGGLLTQDGEDLSQLNLSFSEQDAEATAVVAMSTKSNWNLHTWLNTLESSIETIHIEGADLGVSLYFLVEEAAGEKTGTYTHLYHAFDADNNGLSAAEFTHLAQFAGVGVDVFSNSSFFDAVIPT